MVETATRMGTGAGGTRNIAGTNHRLIELERELADRLTVKMHDLIWEVLYAPIASAIVLASARINILQFLTIRRNLTLVFVALVLLLLVLAI